jgi:hypothetical protein
MNAASKALCSPFFKSSKTSFVIIVHTCLLCNYIPDGKDKESSENDGDNRMKFMEKEGNMACCFRAGALSRKHLNSTGVAQDNIRAK